MTGDRCVRLLVTDRVVRDELLTSERYWSVSIEAQRLFVHLILCADDLGRFSGKNYTIRTSCFPGQSVQAKKVEKLLAELQDADLVRVYQHEGGRFLFIPRFRQRLRYFHGRYPEPPKEINDLPKEKSDRSQTKVGPESDRSQRKRSEVKRSEEKQDSPAFGGSTVWDFGRSLLIEQGLSAQASGSLLGMWLREWTEADVAEALRLAAGKADVRSYVAAVLKAKPKKSAEGKKEEVI